MDPIYGIFEGFHVDISRQPSTFVCLVSRQLTNNFSSLDTAHEAKCTVINLTAGMRSYRLAAPSPSMRDWIAVGARFVIKRIVRVVFMTCYGAFYVASNVAVLYACDCLTSIDIHVKFNRDMFSLFRVIEQGRQQDTVAKFTSL